jgi:hypothetical protein
MLTLESGKLWAVADLSDEIEKRFGPLDNGLLASPFSAQLKK